MSVVRPPTRLLGATVTVDDVGPSRRGRAHPSRLISFVLVAPAVAVVTAMVLIPVARIVYASLIGPEGFGLEHFGTALEVEGLVGAFLRSVAWATVVPAVVTTIGLVVARSLRRWSDHSTGGTLMALAVAPSALPLVVTGAAFRLLYDPDPQRGLVTDLADPLPGISTVNPLLGPRWITLSLMSAFVWAWLGLAVAVFRTALDRLPPQLGEAVRASGGSRWRTFYDGEWRPLLRRTYWIMFALVALATVRVFDLILVMAPGSVVDDASVVAVLQWQTSAGADTGPAAALGVLWLLAVLVGVVLAALRTRQSWPPPPTLEPHPRRPVAPRRRLRPLLAIMLVVWLLPVLVLVGTALHGTRPAVLRGWWQPPFGTRSVTTAWDRGLPSSMGLTFTLAVFVTVIVVLVGLLSAYALAWAGPLWARFAGIALLGAAVVPIQVIATPVTEMLEHLHLSGTPARLALVHAALGIPFAILLLRNAMSDLPPDTVREAQRDSSRQVDATQRRYRLTNAAMWKAIVREARTLWSLATTGGPPRVLAAVALLEFVQVWNDLVVGLLFGGADTRPLGLLVQADARQFVSTSGPLAASAVVAALVPVALMTLGYRVVVDGLVTGTDR